MFIFFLFIFQVKNIRDFHFLSIVSVEKIQKQLAIDCNRTGLCKAVTQLLVNSYYPEIVTDSRPDPGSMSGSDINKERVMKCFQFTKQNVVASVAFYSALHQYVHVGSIAKVLCLQI